MNSSKNGRSFDSYQKKNFKLFKVNLFNEDQRTVIKRKDDRTSRKFLRFIRREIALTAINERQANDEEERLFHDEERRTEKMSHQRRVEQGSAIFVTINLTDSSGDWRSFQCIKLRDMQMKRTPTG